MRVELERYRDKDITIRAFFHRFGYTRHDGMSVLLEKVSDEYGLLTEHAWIPYSEEFMNIEITSGDRIEMDVKVDLYEKKEGKDFGFRDIKNIKMVSRGNKISDVESIAYFTFTVKKEQEVWKGIKGDKTSFIHNENREVQKDVKILPGDRIEIELHKIKSNRDFEFVWRIEREGRWNKHAYFNPIKYGQALCIYSSYRIYLSQFVYFLLKDFYFKTYYSKVPLDIPYTRELVHYAKPTKFKYRKVVNYDIDGNLIEDEFIIKKRAYVFDHSSEIINDMSEEEIFAMFEKQFGSTKGLQPYTKQQSPYYKDTIFLYKKARDALQSAPIELKNSFVDYFIDFLTKKGEDLDKLVEENEKKC